MFIDRKIQIQNIYYMLSYAFHILKEKDYQEVSVEEFENVHDLMAAILSKGVARQLKQGLYKEYVTKCEDMQVLRGKVHMPGTIRNKLRNSNVLTCEFDELSENNIYNQIIKTTLSILVRQSNVKLETKLLLKKELVFFDNVALIDIKTIQWRRIRFDKNNQNYKLLLNICNLIIEGMIMSDDTGNYKLAQFVDDQRMCALYEKFVLEYFRYHYKGVIEANPVEIYWNVDDNNTEFLPIMKTDITLKKGDRTLIIDTKYYNENLQKQFDKYTIKSNNLYQIFTYVKNYDKYDKKNVSGMLLYIKTIDEVQPNADYVMSGNPIHVRNLDMNMDFSEIAKQLDTIAQMM